MFGRPLKPSPSLRLSLLLFLVAPLIAVLAFSGYYSLERLEDQVEKRMQEDIELIGRAIRGPLEYALEHGREGSLSQALSSVFRIGRVYGAYVYDKEGRKIATSGPREPVVRSKYLAELAAGNRTGEYQESDGKKVYSYFIPLSDSLGRNSGLLHLTRDGTDIKRYIEEVRHQALLLLLLLSLLLLLIVVYGHHRMIGRNVKNLARSMARIEQGERSHRAALQGPQEVRQLADGMNAMLDSIARSEQELADQRRAQAHLENELQQSRKMAALGRLSAGVAHELGTPLSVVSGKAQRMLRRTDLPDHVTMVFVEIRDAVQRMEHIVRQLLDFGRANKLSLRPMALNDVAECAAAQVRAEAQQKSIDMHLEGPRPAPVVELDRLRIEQGLVNLLRNAVQATEVGGRVRLGWFVNERHSGFYVADDGPGIAPELHCRLFEPFFTTKEVGEGTGLGLSVAQAAVDDHNGRLEIGSSELGGALFTMLFAKADDNRGGRQ